MDWMNDLNWFAIQTKPYRENLAASHVMRFDIDVFLPKLRREQYICGMRRLVTKVLFPGYFFGYFCPQLSFDEVRYAPGVLRVVGTRQSPIPVAPQVIETIRDRIQPDGFVHLKTSGIESGNRVRIEEGPFAGWMGRVEREPRDDGRVAILLEAIQQARVLIEGRWLTVMAGAT